MHLMQRSCTKGVLDTSASGFVTSGQVYVKDPLSKQKTYTHTITKGAKSFKEGEDVTLRLPETEF